MNQLSIFNWKCALALMKGVSGVFPVVAAVAVESVKIERHEVAAAQSSARVK